VGLPRGLKGRPTHPAGLSHRGPTMGSGAAPITGRCDRTTLTDGTQLPRLRQRKGRDERHVDAAATIRSSISNLVPTTTDRRTRRPELRHRSGCHKGSSYWPRIPLRKPCSPIRPSAPSGIQKRPTQGTEGGRTASAPITRRAPYFAHAFVLRCVVIAKLAAARIRLAGPRAARSLTSPTGIDHLGPVSGRATGASQRPIDSPPSSHPGSPHQLFFGAVKPFGPARPARATRKFNNGLGREGRVRYRGPHGATTPPTMGTNNVHFTNHLSELATGNDLCGGPPWETGV